ncbi:DUF418 domain-containing protein [Litorimonas sp. WD9-15]|uniref:DUF418 domain-containing protein n=1 Tax=Litorimonas sp. WD9-15 TaxID=3418716 RepID=UPI003D093C49
MSYTAESQAAGRHILPDLVRAFAVLGIVLVNVAYFAYPGEVTYHAGGLNTSLDHAAYFGVNAFFLFKAYTLFSLMFGVGLAYQMQSAERRGLKFGRRYTRRILGLLILGILHVTFAFVGDILIIYAIMGAILYAYKDKTVKSLLRWGIVLISLQILLALLAVLFFRGWETHAADEMALTITQIEANFPRYYDIYSNGSFSDVMRQRWIEWVGYLIFAGPTQMPGILGFFVLGLATVKSGIISDPSAAIWSKARRYAFPIGMVISLYAAYLMFQVEQQFSSQSFFAMAIILIGSPFATFGYLGWLAKWAAGPDTAFKTFIARGGTATLTAYLLQSIILSFIFTGYGLGYYGDVGAAGCIAIALATGIFTLTFVSLWRIKFARGPFEYVLRGFTYWGDNR